MNYDIIIIGGGVAGLTAAIYIRRANKTVLILESTVVGGQVLQTFKIDNYPAMPGISGPDLIKSMKSQAKDLGAEFKTEKALKITGQAGNFAIETDEENTYKSSAIILATGTDYRHLNLPGEDELIGHGISFCATCDGALYKDKDIAVYGGGNSAIYSAIYLADIAKKVYVIHRRNEFRADAALVDKLKSKRNVELVLQDNVTDFISKDGNLSGLQLESGKTLEVSALFVTIGRVPADAQLCTASPNITIDHDTDGYIKTDDTCATSQPGIFAAGDCRSKSVRQIITAAGDGAIAATSALKSL